MKNIVSCIIALMLCTSCGVFRTKLPQTMGEQNASYTYVPLDPLPVSSQPGNSCAVGQSFKDTLASLPDNAVRIAVGKYDSTGKLSFGPAQIGVNGNDYQVVLDYINADVTTIPFVMSRPNGRSIYDLSDKYMGFVDFEDRIIARRVSDTQSSLLGSSETIVPIPVYVGVGLRLTASISVLNGTVNLSSLGGIATEAQAGNVSGSLVVQTLGITGKQVATTLPLPSELNATTVQNAILSLGSIKAIMYGNDAIVSARVTGIYNPISGYGADLINAIVSELAKEPIPWRRPCELKKGLT
ncbi:MAG: hypothetical protein WAS21_30210 [Geminicoccaceae bacterium]